ncbi:MAG: hypothetical protein QOE70_1430 [Chthoniobacter sp.]|jgi:hypothetical protein|nr:hypothetical protein [Chthoniobacter sp.]
MSDEIKRKVELWLCREMRAAIPGSRAVPSKGGDDGGGEADQPEPPFTFAKVVECNEITPQGAEVPGVYQITVKVARVSHIDETSAPQHSAQVQQFREALRGLRRGYYEPLQLVINGIDFAPNSSNEEISDADQQAHGDVFTLVMGVTG